MNVARQQVPKQFKYFSTMNAHIGHKGRCKSDIHSSDKNQVNKVTAKQDKMGGGYRKNGTPVSHRTHSKRRTSSLKTTGPKGVRNLP